MRQLVALAVLCAAPPPARGDRWTGLDVGLEATFGAVLLADYLQTRAIVADGREGNPIMGERGERVSPEVYFASVAAVHLVAAHVLPGRWRTAFQGIAVGWQVDVVHTNWQAGYRVTF